MAPQKSLPQAKLNLVLAFFRTNAVAYTIKELERLLPSAAGISSMVVKDYLAALFADSLLCVEKIGSINWYWSFPSDAKRQKENVLNEARKERDKLRNVLMKCEQGVEEEKKRLSGGAEAATSGGNPGKGGRLVLIERLRDLESKRQNLKEEMESFSTAKGIDQIWDEKEELRLRVNTIIDNLYTLEKFIKDSTGDSNAVNALKEQLGIEEEIEYIEA